MDENDIVVSAWQADRETIDSYLRDGAKADDWNEGEWPRGFDPDNDQFEPDDVADKLRTIAAYGDEVGRNGQITDKRRREFWISGD